MDLTLSRAGDHAVRAAIALAGAWDEDRLMTIDEIAADMELPRAFLPQVLGMLSRAGLAEGKAGRGGGYRLARAPGKITILEIVEAIEGPLGTTRCPLAGGPCRWDDACAIHPTWMKAANALRAAMGHSTLVEIAREDRNLGTARRRRRAAGLSPKKGASTPKRRLR